ncbi:MAG TPA: heme o synthase [Streptosporangiaceae bacterium]|jgi:protoheme IX farnesyltransferase|nr:heme o synthase [Streptosporangiaceae bacterium]
MTRLRAYVALTKPRIIELLLITTLPAMFLAAHGLPRLWLVVATLIGGTASAAGANVLNCYIDRDIDAKMRRTRRRPLAKAEVSAREALVFGLLLVAGSTCWLGFGVNWLASGLALFACAFYVFGYSLLLKRRTAQNVVWGGIAGCMPVLVGWTAVTGRLALAPFALFGVVFFWTPPHTWALAMRFKEDYAAAGVPMLPVVAAERAVTGRILWYAWLTICCSLLIWPPGGPGLVVYLAVAAVLGVLFLREAYRLHNRVRSGESGIALRPMRLFHWSNAYLALLFLAVAVSPLLR